MKSNVIVALIVGAVLGFVVGRATGTGSAAIPSAPTAQAPNAPSAPSSSDVGKTAADLPETYIKESDLPAGSFAGLTEQQKYSALKAANEANCDCGCQNDSIAKCRKNDPNCARAPAMLTQVIALAKQGRNAEQIKAEVGKKPSPSAAPNRPPDDSNVTYKVPIDDAYCKGPKTAKVTIVESTDFQWPFCGRVGPTLKELETKYGKDLRICVKENPLPFHQFAAPAAEAALAAGEQGKYWEMHEKLFANQQALDRPSLEKYAQELGLNLSQFKAALDQQKFKDRIQKDQNLVNSLGASGTPAFFINGRKLSGALPTDKFASIIDEEMKKADDLLKKGTRPADVYDAVMKDARTSPPQAPAPAAQAPQPAPFKKVEIASFNPVKGPKTAKVTIIEFSDFQWPFCSRVGPTLKQIEDTYGKDVRIAFRNQPLPFHPYAMPAAEAAMAANEQGKFWEMEEKLFSNQGKINAQNPMPDLERLAQEAGLDMSRFKSAMESHKFKSQIEEDSKYGNTVGANGTPTFFINGHLVSGAMPFESFKTVIDEQIKKADELLKKGVKPEKLYERILEEGASAAPAPSAVPTSTAEPERKNVTVGSAPTKGPSNAPVTIIEFSDFQWPFCGRVGPTLKQIEETYQGKVRIAFKNKALPFHQFAMGAAEAALAANAQGRFWEMHDKLFANQQALDRPALERYAQELNLDMGRFRSDLDSGKFKGAINEDVRLGDSVGAGGTPTFFINGRMVVGAQPFEQFKTIIDEELAKKVAKK